MDKSEKVNYAHWKIRRKVVGYTLVFCAAVVAYCIYANTGSRTEETAVLSSYGLAGAVIGSYIFGAVWEDTSNGVRS